MKEAEEEQSFSASFLNQVVMVVPMSSQRDGGAVEPLDVAGLRDDNT